MLKENLQHVLESPNSFWQSQWNRVWEWSGNDEFNLIIWGTFIVSTAVYWIIGLAFCPIDLTGKPQFVMKYRIQKDSNYPVTLNEFGRVVVSVVFNQVTVNLPFLWMCFKLLTWRGCDTRTLPTFQRTLSDLLCCMFLQEILYFYIHRFLHTPLMLKYHKLHHQWHSPIAITALYCHPVEHITANLFPLLIGPLVLGSHLSTVWLWMSIATVGTLFIHSGFPILPLPKTEFHNYHHMKKHHNFGLWGLMDRLYGTNGFQHSDKVH